MVVKTYFRPLFCFSILLGEGNGTPLQYSCLENPMDGGAWKAAVHGVTEGWTQLSDFTFTFQWLELGAFTAKGLVSISGWETKIPQATWHSQRRQCSLRQETPEGSQLPIHTFQAVA